MNTEHPLFSSCYFPPSLVGGCFIHQCTKSQCLPPLCLPSSSLSPSLFLVTHTNRGQIFVPFGTSPHYWADYQHAFTRAPRPEKSPPNPKHSGKLHIPLKTQASHSLNHTLSFPDNVLSLSLSRSLSPSLSPSLPHSLGQNNNELTGPQLNSGRENNDLNFLNQRQQTPLGLSLAYIHPFYHIPSFILKSEHWTTEAVNLV